MKSKILIIVLCFLFYNISLIAQECKVLKPEISDTYIGKCKNGLAHGRKGIAVGKDRYEGGFKEGLPSGKGKYTYASGEIYEGYWKEGKRNGEGKYYYKKNGVDSVKFGVWANDVLVKKILPPQYKVTKSISVARYTVQNRGVGNRVLFSFLLAGSNNTTLSNVLFTSSSGTSYELGAKQGFDNVVFPFKCKVTYTTSNLLHTYTYNVEFEIEITASGDWDISLNN